MMNVKAPKLDARNADDVVNELEQDLSLKQKWRGQEGGGGYALVRLFGRLSELIINRLNEAPNKHFLAFLNEAEIGQDPPRPARTNVSFTPIQDAPAAIHVPAGTQIATQPSPTLPQEVIFETQEELVVVGNKLTNCIVIDPKNYADRTEEANGLVLASFPAFAGNLERQRILYLADEELFTFEDETSRKLATITLRFEFSSPGVPPAKDPWQIDWFYWDGEKWQDLRLLFQAPSILRADLLETFLFSIAGKLQTALDQGILSEEIRSTFAGQGAPLVNGATVEVIEKGARWHIRERQRHHYSIQKKGELDVYKTGRPSQALSKLFAERGLPLTEDVGITQVDDGCWQLNDEAKSYEVREKTDGLYILDPSKIVDHTNNFSQNGVVEFKGLPVLGETTVGGLMFSLSPNLQRDLEISVLSETFRRVFKDNGIDLALDALVKPGKEEGTWLLTNRGQIYTIKRGIALEVYLAEETAHWLACELTKGSSREHLPILDGIFGSYRIETSAVQTAQRNIAFSATQTNTAFIPIDLTDEFFPLGQRPGQLDTFYLASTEAFSKPGVIVTLEMAEFKGVTEIIPQEGAEKARWRELDALEVVWEYFSTQGWTRLGSSKRTGFTSERLNFEDRTNAFTIAGTDSTPPYIRFETPGPGRNDPPFQATMVNQQGGYWVRARVVAGSYNVHAYVNVINAQTGNYQFFEAKTYAPLIKNLKVTYSAFQSGRKEKAIKHSRSLVDWMLSEHSAALMNHAAVPVFNGRDEGQALYLGFDRAFPAGQWITLLMHVDETKAPSGPLSPIIWQYWDGAHWTLLQILDKTANLSERGYLGFYARDNHQPGTEFGRTAYWLRGCLHTERPQAKAKADPTVVAPPAKAETTLQADASSASNGQEIVKYTWRLVASTPPIANAGTDIMVATSNMQATVTLDATGSQATDQQHIKKYVWRYVKPDPPEPALPLSYLKGIGLNTVSALNTETLIGEGIGSSNGNREQIFKLTRTPVLANDAIIAIREPDRPPQNELLKLETELRSLDENAQALLAPPAVPDEVGWVRWNCVPDFHDSKKQDRHFTLDPITGEIRFGDGVRGKIPPAGYNNIRAVRYRTHNGASSNVGANALTVLRNPSGDLSNIQSVVNREPSVGGADAEPVERVQERGPQTLQHRHQAVTQSGYEWLARDALGEVVRAYRLPTRNREGSVEPAWVTVVIIPALPEAKPSPTPAQLRFVREYLEARTLTNLIAGTSRIYVKGPEYIEVNVRVRVVPKKPAQSDAVVSAIRQRLNDFFHPLHGGPERTGWELGRNVYFSEVQAEIEAVEGVDYIVEMQLSGSIQLYQLQLANSTRRQASTPEEQGGLPYEIPASSQVSTIDGRIKLLLTEPIARQTEDIVQQNSDALKDISVYGFKAGDKVVIVADDNQAIVSDLIVASVTATEVTFQQAHSAPEDRNRCAALQSLDEHIRLPLDKKARTMNEKGQSVNADLKYDKAGNLVGVTIQSFKKGDLVYIISPGRHHPSLDALPVVQVDQSNNRIFVPEDHLVVSAETHDIRMVIE